MSDKKNCIFFMKEFTNREKHTYYSVEYCLVSVSLFVCIVNSQKDMQNNCTHIFYSCCAKAIGLDILF